MFFFKLVLLKKSICTVFFNLPSDPSCFESLRRHLKKLVPEVVYMPHIYMKTGCLIAAVSASFVLQHLADGRQPHQTAVAYIKQEKCGDAPQAKSLVMAFSKLFADSNGNETVISLQLAQRLSN